MLRLPNLGIVYLSLFLPYYMVVRPAIVSGGGLPNLTEAAFNLLAFATVLTTFAGYFVNDIFDEKIDVLNRPERQVIGKYLPRPAAFVIYTMLIGIILWLAHRLGTRFFPDRRQEVFLLFAGVSAALFVYARFLKCSPVLGNLVVAILCSIVPIIVLEPELRPLHLLELTQPELAQRTKFLCWNFVIFAFATNFFREMLKDIEDFAGDAACGCRTLPVLRGIPFARRVAALAGFLLLATLLMLTFYWYQTSQPLPKIILAATFLCLPCVFAIFKTAFGKASADFAKASLAVKIIMLAGLLLLSF